MVAKMKQSRLSPYFTNEPICPYCGKRFSNQGALQSHIKQVHYHVKPQSTVKNSKNQTKVEVELPKEFVEWCKENNIRSINLDVISNFLMYKQLQELKKHDIVS
jgi:uncharacterized Zn-finger protein